MEERINQKIRLSLSFFIVGFLISLLFYFVAGTVLKLPRPLDSIFFTQNDYFADFLGNAEFNFKMDPFNTIYRGFHANYPPGCFLILLPFTNINIGLGLIAHALFYFIALIYAYMNKLKPYRTNLPLPLFVTALTFACMNYPSIYALERQNVENLLFVLVIIYLFTVNTKFEKVGLVALSAAASAKIYPILFLIAEERKSILKKGVFVVLGSLVFTGIALWVFNTSWSNLINTYSIGKSYNYGYFIKNPDGINYGTSLYGMIKTTIELITGEILDEETTITLFTIAPFLVLPFFLFTAYVYFKKEIALWQKLFFASSFILLWPNVSSDYKLIHAFPAFIYFLIAPPLKFDRTLTILFSVLFVPMGYFVVHGAVTAAVIIRPIIIMTIWTLTMLVVFDKSANKSDLKK